MSESYSRSDQRCLTSENVVTAVASALDTSPLDLTPPLYERVDPEALDSLVQSGPADLHVRFRYNGCTVAVDGRGRVDVSPADETAAPREGTED